MTNTVQSASLGVEHTVPGSTKELRIKVLEAAVVAGLYFKGPEFNIPRTGIRFAPVGGRKGNRLSSNLPHYHRRVIDPKYPQQPMPGQGMKRHRPWESKSTDKKFTDRF